MSIKEILESQELNVEDKLTLLQEKTNYTPSWSDTLEKEYNPRKHPVMDKSTYPDIVNGTTYQPVTRVMINLQKLAAKRLVELCCGIPIKRIYSPENDKQKEVASTMEKVFMRTRIDSVNNERLEMLFASCEVMTLWYAVLQDNSLYGRNSKIKLRVRNYSPMKGDELFPLFDENDDLVAMSVRYQRKTVNKVTTYFDVYTDELHVKFSDNNEGWREELREPITILKIPAIYISRPTPAWEDESNKVYEMEWALSRNGNYLRENSRPLLVVCAEEEINYGSTPTASEESKRTNRRDTDGDEVDGGGFKDVVQFPKGSNVKYVTWQQAVENLKFYIEQLRSLFFTELQLPDWSYEKMSQHALSGESRKQMFIDAQLKVKDESGRLLEAFDREVNVLKAFLKKMFPADYSADIDALQVENVVTPFTITDEHDTIDNLLTASGNMPLMSQREAIEALGWSSDVDKTLREIQEQGSGAEDAFSQFTTE